MGVSYGCKGFATATVSLRGADRACRGTGRPNPQAALLMTNSRNEVLTQSLAYSPIGIPWGRRADTFWKQFLADTETVA
jgi:hypothetical protein